MSQSTQLDSAVQRVVAQIRGGALHGHLTGSLRAVPYRAGASEDNFRKRVTRSGSVPIELAKFDYKGWQHRILIAPICKGKEPGTLRIRYFRLSDDGGGRDMGRSTVMMSAASAEDGNFIDYAWKMLSAHQRMAMYGAVAHRTPQGGVKGDANA